MNELLTKDQILAADDCPFEIVQVPEWKGAVRVQALTGHARELYDRSLANSAGTVEDFKTKLVAYSLTDAAGKPIFTLDDVNELRKKSNAALERVFEVADRLSKITAIELEQTAKN